jgi:hypothetical protein
MILYNYLFTLYYYNTKIKCNKIIIFNPILGYEYYINLSSWDDQQLYKNYIFMYNIVFI